MNKHIAAAAVYIGLSLLVASVKADVAPADAQPASPVAVSAPVHQDLTSFLVDAAKFAGSYISSNGTTVVGFGLSNMGGDKRGLQVNPILGQAITPICIGKIGVDSLQLGFEHATYFDHTNREMLGVVGLWNVFHLSKVGKLFPGLDFNQISVQAGWDVPVECFGGQHIRLSTMVLHFGGGLKF